MSLPSSLRSILEQTLSDSEINRFESGESALFVSEPKYAFFRVDNGEYQRADVMRNLNPDGDAQMQIYHEIYRTTPSEVQERLENASDIDIFPVDIGFGGDDLDDN